MSWKVFKDDVIPVLMLVAIVGGFGVGIITLHKAAITDAEAAGKLAQQVVDLIEDMNAAQESLETIENDLVDLKVKVGEVGGAVETMNSTFLELVRTID